MLKKKKKKKKSVSNFTVQTATHTWPKTRRN